MATAAASTRLRGAGPLAMLGAIMPDEVALPSQLRARWERLGWSLPLAAGAFALPEAHYLDVAPLGLDPPRRVALNRLFASFTCELFVHFEGYVIRYLEAARAIPGVSAAAIARFVEEERVHSEMFQRLLGRLRPDLYPAPRPEPRFLSWSWSDDTALALAPMGTFFLLAWLFEEITLFVPTAIDRAPEQGEPVVAGVMRLHAREEQPHVAVDQRVLAHLAGRARLISLVEGALALPLLVYVDAKVRVGWRRLAERAAHELGLDARQRALVERRGPTQSDRWGMESFARKLQESRLPGTLPLRLALLRELARGAK